MATKKTNWWAEKQRFTLDEYLSYTMREKWRDDDPENNWDSEDDYKEYWVALVDDWLDQSRSHFRSLKMEWGHAVRRFENFLDRLREMVSSKADPAFTSLPFLYKALMDLVALLFDSLPRPSFQSRQSSIDDFAAALNYYANWELDANDFDLLMYDVGLDVQLFNLGCIKQTVDRTEDGPMGQEGRIIINRTEPRYLNPDPMAQKLEWKALKYIIEASPYDVGEIRSMYPETGQYVNPEAHYSVSRADENDETDDLSPQVIKSPANTVRGGPFAIGERGRAMLKECWLKDATLEFQATEEWHSNIELEPYESGVLEKEILEGRGRGWMEPVVDDDTGFVEGKWVKKYPNGRCVVTCNGVWLTDMDNPYSHGECPYVFFRGRPTKQLLSVGDASFLILVERKLNDIYNRIFRMGQANIERPKMCDIGAFDAPRKWHNIEAASDLILQVRPNSNFKTMEPGEIPQFVAPYAQMLRSFFDDLMGVNSVMQGKLQGNEQLSAETLGNLQDQAGTRTRMKARFIEFALKRTGYQLMWNIRDTYKSGEQVDIIDPITRQKKTITWTPEDAKKDDYVVVINAGSSLPGAKQGAYQQALTLYRERIVDDEYVLAAAQVPSAERVIDRKRTKQLQDIEAQATGRALGLQVKEQMKTDERPGRKPQE